MLRSKRPVSYTHLDVYKRQELALLRYRLPRLQGMGEALSRQGGGGGGGGGARRGAGETKLCLLYTSRCV